MHRETRKAEVLKLDTVFSNYTKKAGKKKSMKWSKRTQGKALSACPELLSGFSDSVCAAGLRQCGGIIPCAVFLE